MTENLNRNDFENGVLNLVNKLNSFNLPGSSRSSCFIFVVDDQQIGFVLPKVAAHLRKYPNLFEFEDKKIILNPAYKTPQERTLILEETLLDLRAKHLFKKLDGWRNEHYDVKAKFNTKPLFTMERAAVSLFGLKAYGCHVNGYIEKDNSYFLWIARRSKSKQTFPGMLDNFCGGGLTTGLNVFECAAKELEEETGLGAELTSLSLQSVDAISYAYEEDDEEGVCIEGEFVFDLKLPNDFEPKNNDGEVDSFVLMNMQQVKKAIIGNDFKPNSAAITLGFLIRKGVVTPIELPSFLEILAKLHMPDA